MFTHTTIHKTLLTAVVLSVTSLASAHNFSKPKTRAEVSAEHFATCKAAVKTGASAKRSFTRFAPETVVTTGGYRTAGNPRFSGGSSPALVACTRPMRSHTACL